jgi:nuclear cap-binding protein subunit 1
VTSICFIGSKSLSHVLSCIERCRERLLAIAATSSAAQRQIIASVFDYWRDQPGIAVNIVDKLLNYTILSPGAVLDFAIGTSGPYLAESYIFEMADATVKKVTKRVRQIATSRDVTGLPVEQRELLELTLQREREAMRTLFKFMEDTLVAWASGSKDQEIEMGDGTSEAEALVRQWGQRWLRVFRRRFAVEETWAVDVDALYKAKLANAAENGAENGITETMDVEV